MTYKEFKKWFKHYRAYKNGQFCGMFRNSISREIIESMNKYPFWRREKIWKEKYEKMVVENIVDTVENEVEEKF